MALLDIPRFLTELPICQIEFPVHISSYRRYTLYDTVQYIVPASARQYQCTFPFTIHIQHVPSDSSSPILISILLLLHLFLLILLHLLLLLSSSSSSSYSSTSFPPLPPPPRPPPPPSPPQIKGSGGLLSKITFTGEDTNFLLARQQALEV